VEVERGADADHHRGGDAAERRRHPALLLGRAEPNPHDVGPLRVDGRDRVRGLGLGHRAEGRRHGAGDREPGIARGEAARERLGHALAPAEEEMPVALRQRVLAQREHQVGPVDALGLALAGEAAQPHQRHAVRGDEIGAIVDATERGIPARFHYRVHVGDADIAGLARRDPAVDGRERTRHAQRRQADAQDVHALRCRHGASPDGARSPCGGARKENGVKPRAGAATTRDKKSHSLVAPQRARQVLTSGYAGRVGAGPPSSGTPG
jgi:hypothetical protein